MASVKKEAMDDGEKAAGTGGIHGLTERPDGGTTTNEQPRRRLSTKGVRRPGYKRRVNAPHSYVQLITMAIKASTTGMLTLGEILSHLRQNNQCFQGSYDGWKNSVRHTLSSSSCFVKLLRNSNRPYAKDNFWAMNPDCPHCLNDMDQKRETPVRLNVEEAPSTPAPQPSPLAPQPSPLAPLPYPLPQAHQLTQGVLPRLSPVFPMHQPAPDPRLYIAHDSIGLPPPTTQETVSQCPVSSTPPLDVSPAPSPALDDLVQSVPLDLSLPKKRNQFKRDHNSVPSQSRKKHKSAFTASRNYLPPNESPSETTLSPELKQHNLPVSRFLSCSNADTPCTISYGANAMKEEQKTLDFHSQFPITPLQFRPPINSWYAMVPPHNIPKTAEEWAMLRHYWDRVMAHKGALYREHQARLEELRAKQAGDCHHVSSIPPGMTSHSYTPVPAYTAVNCWSPRHLQMASHTV